MRFSPGAAADNVVQTVDQTNRTTTTVGSFADTGVQAIITPSSASSKVLVEVSLTAGLSVGGIVHYTLDRNSTALTPAGNDGLSSMRFSSSGEAPVVAFSYLDSPASTSAQTYKLQADLDGAGTAYFGRRGSGTDIDSPNIITLTEILQ